MKVAAIQMVSGQDARTNLDTALQLIAQAAASGAELVGLPEYFCLIGQHDSDKLAIQEPFGRGPFQDALGAAARQHGVWIAGGTLPITASTPDHVSNTTLVWSPQGETVARYDKIHLFAFDNGRESYDESRVLEAGRRPAVFELASRDGHTWRVALSVCYDMRFPELYRQLQPELIMAPSAFTHTTGQAHWEVLLRARAIENLAYLMAPAQGGLHPSGRRTWGQTLAIDPWGTVLAQQAEGTGMVMAECDWQRVQQVREQLPALRHRVF
ncbi:MAG: carbon-nitrogen hydrolase family protein [Limnohabitans sp.]